MARIIIFSRINPKNRICLSSRYIQSPLKIIMQPIVPSGELQDRMDRLRSLMDNNHPDWDYIAIIGKLNQYYFTGTMQDGMLLIPSDDEAVFWVRRSYERATGESGFTDIRPMNSYRDIAGAMGKISGNVYLEKELVPVGLLERIRKHLPFDEIRSVDNEVSEIRAVKSEYELSFMKEAGRIHRQVLEDKVPDLLREGMSEVDFFAELNTSLLEEGHDGVVRFGMFDTEIPTGQVGFGDSSIYPSFFNSPCGNFGMSPAVPMMCSRMRKLRKNDLVFVDIGCSVNGYHTDKTMTYMFGGPIPEDAIEDHKKCVEIQNRMAAMLKPGAFPSAIYNTIMDSLEPDFLENFMGFKEIRVNFLGHGIGLQVDEKPVIARGFDQPILEGMVFALEPKKGVENVGMVGIENTFLVTPVGGKSITGNHPGLMPVY